VSAADLASGAGQVLSGVAHGFSRIADSVAEAVEGAVDLIAGFFGGGSSAPAPKAAPPEAPPPPKRRLSVEEYVAQEIEQRKAERQELARKLGAGEAITKEELERIEMEQQKNAATEAEDNRARRDGQGAVPSRPSGSPAQAILRSFIRAGRATFRRLISAKEPEPPRPTFQRARRRRRASIPASDDGLRRARGR
jgi:hypothetical protein